METQREIRDLLARLAAPVSAKEVGLQLQRRERELRAARIETLKLELDAKEAQCAAHRAELKARIEALCVEYEDATKLAISLRRDFENACASDDAIRHQLKDEARQLGFKLVARRPQ